MRSWYLFVLLLCGCTVDLDSDARPENGGASGAGAGGRSGGATGTGGRVPESEGGSSGGVGSGGSSSGSGGSAAAEADFCAVQRVLAAQCQACHGKPPLAGVPV